MFSKIILPVSLAALAFARTDLTGCTSTDVSSPAGASIAWYVPGTGEICAFLDCGGGAGAPVTTVPGCAAYSGTATYSPSYLPGYPRSTGSVAGNSLTESSTGKAHTTAAASTSSSAAASGSSSSASAIVDTIINTSSGASAASTSSEAAQSTTKGSVNGTVSTSSPSSTAGLSGAAPSAQAWMGGAGLLMGLGAVVAAL